jgi:hypothetical protein
VAALLNLVLVFWIAGLLVSETRFDGAVLAGFAGRCDVSEITSVTRSAGCLRIRCRGRWLPLYVPDDPELARRLQDALGRERSFSEERRCLERAVVCAIAAGVLVMPLLLGHLVAMYCIGGWPGASPGSGQEVLYRGLSPWDPPPEVQPAWKSVDIGPLRIDLPLEEIRLACTVGDLPIYDVIFVDGGRLTVSPGVGELTRPGGEPTALAALLPPAWTTSESDFLLHALAMTPARHHLLMGLRELMGLAVAARIHREDQPHAPGYRRLNRPPLDIFAHRRADQEDREHVRVVVGAASLSITLAAGPRNKRVPERRLHGVVGSLALRAASSMTPEAFLVRRQEAEAAARRRSRGEATLRLVSAMGIDPSAQPDTWLACWELVVEELESSPGLSLGNRLEMARRTLRRIQPRGGRLLARLEALGHAGDPPP